MSSLRNALQRRNHRERSQLESRATRFGLLEKHKDYVLRAKDYNRKQKTLRTLKQKAAFRNPDEFYFGMVNASTKKGVHVATRERDEKMDADFLRLLKTQDQGYVNYQRSVNASRVDKLKEGLHFLEEEQEYQDDDDDDAEEEEEDHGAMEVDDQDETIPGGLSSSRRKRTPQHTVFVDSIAEGRTERARKPSLPHRASIPKLIHPSPFPRLAAKSFSPSEHFRTPASLLHRKYNRPTTDMLETAELPPAASRPNARKREKAYRELSARLDREDKLRKAQLEMDLQKNLMGKGPKKKTGVDEQGLPVYKWKAVRKR
ncbi:UTP11-like, U3 small nucleolar ribonucleoprotein [Thoreauomyces humboldtii]|nr:UTP11-like, U3 small nucleolar ribonucleoprotein [Thoreauomyces humboldtii]